MHQMDISAFNLVTGARPQAAETRQIELKK